MIRFLVNPAAGRGRAAARVGELRELVAARGADLAVSSSAADLTRQARGAAAAGVERLVVAGGDGSVHLAAEGLAGSRCALAALPLGSGNDLAAALGVPSDLPGAVEVAVAGAVQPVDLLRVDGRPCLGVAGVGFDSAANETANRVRWISGPAVYLYAVLHTLATFRPPAFEVRYEKGRFIGPAMMVVLANGPRFGGGMRIAPGALLDDGSLDLVIVRAVSRATFLRVFPRVYRGSHLGHPAVIAARTPWAEVRLDRPMHVYGDGERLLPVPAEGVRFEVAPRSLLAVVGGDAAIGGYGALTPRTPRPGPGAAPRPS